MAASAATATTAAESPVVRDGRASYGRCPRPPVALSRAASRKKTVTHGSGRCHPPPRETLRRWGLLAGSCVASTGDELVNLESTSTVAYDGVQWRPVMEASHLWRPLPPVGALSLHGK
jgi:hypothetical protein